MSTRFLSQQLRTGAPATEHSPVRTKRPDDGFTLVEVVVALGIISVVMTSLTVFMVNSRRSGHYSSLRDTAVQVAAEGMEKARAVRGSALLGGRAQCAGTCPAVVSTTVSDLLGAGTTRWDAPAAGTLTVPAPGTQADGSAVTQPADPEVVVLDGTTFRRYYYLGTCWQPRLTTSATGVTCGTATDTAQLARLVVAVTWTGRECSPLCSYAEAGLFSVAVTDPFLAG
jgi:prepilin-type N-terminal cleavage/methylation domain-containing protein